MKKTEGLDLQIGLIAALLLGIVIAFGTFAHANFDFGLQTYASAGTSLVVNSLGDRGTVSQFGNLGTNDWIPENAMKNSLALDGYTKAYDKQDSVAHNWTFDNGDNYLTPLPSGPALHEIDFRGLLGDPRAIQKTFVLQSEWDKYSAQSQDSRINQTNITLGNEIDSRTNMDYYQNNAIGSLNNWNIVRGNQIVAETDARIAGDNTLRHEIEGEAGQRQYMDQVLQSNIDHTNTRMDDLNTATNKRVDAIDQVKVMADVSIRLLDFKHVSFAVFDMYDAARARNFAIGARLTYKVGDSYEGRMIAEQEKKIRTLELLVNRMLDARSQDAKELDILERVQ